MKLFARMLSILFITAILCGLAGQPVNGQSKPAEAAYTVYLPVIMVPELPPQPVNIYLPFIQKAFVTRHIIPGYSPAATAMVVSPHDSNVVYAGTYGGGVYKSLDGGVSWISANHGLPQSASVMSMAIDPTNASRIYVGLIYNNEPDWASGVYRSDDGGQTWTATGRMDNPDAGSYANRVVVYSLDIYHDGSVIYAATRTRVPVPPYTYGYGGVFKSTNYGASWNLVNNGLPSGDLYVYDLAVDLTDPNWAYAALHGSGVYRTSNGGAWWTPVNLGVAPDVVNTTAHRAIVVDAAAENRLLFGTTGQASYASSNYASSWALRNPNDVFMFTVDPNRDHGVYATNGSGSVFYSDDFGNSWDARASGATDGFLAADPNAPGVLYTGGANGQASLLKSINGGDSFFPASSGLSGYPITSLVVDPNSGSIIISLFGWGVLASTDGSSWTALNAGLPTLSIQGLVMDPNHPANLYALTPANGIYQSSNGGASWAPMNSGYPSAGAGISWDNLPYREPLRLEEIFGQAAADKTPALNAAAPSPALSLVLAPSSPGLMLAGTSGKGVIRRDGGSWTATSVSTGAVYALLFDSATPGRAWLGGSPASGTLQVSNDQGLHWTPAANGLAGRTVYALSQATSQPDVLLAGTDGGIYLSQDGGASWALSALPGQQVRAVAVHPQDSGRLVAATSTAIYLSQNGGASWEVTEPGHSGYGYLGVFAPHNKPGYFYFYSRYNGIVVIYR